MAPIRPLNFDQAPKKSKKHGKKILAGFLVACLVGLAFWLQPWNRQPAPLGAKNSPVPKSSFYVQFNKDKYSLNDPSSLWAIANKGRQLPADYVPANLVNPNVPLRLDSSSPEMMLRQDAASALAQMFTAAQKDDLKLMLASGYRPYSQQVALYNRYVSQDGQAAADTYSAKPGHSEHQLGLAADVEPVSRICEVDQCFADTAEGKWVAANAYKSGFIIRYPKGKESQTGYEYEPWHVRYVGAALAAQIYKTDTTLEQFFGLPYYDSYPDQPYKLSSGL